MTVNSPETVTKCAVVVGGSGGIGAAVCRVLAREGWDIRLTYRSNAERAQAVADEITALGQTAELVQAELPTDVERVFEPFGSNRSLHGYVYAAGPYVPQRYINQISPQTMESIFHNDLMSFYSGVSAALPHLRETAGTVVSVVTPAIVRYAPRDVLSSAPKAAIESIIKGIAFEEGRYGIRANAVGVGVIEGDGMWTALVESGDFSPAMLAAAKAGTALKKFGDVSDIAEAVEFLMSKRARWITGQTLNVDGGYSI